MDNIGLKDLETTRHVLRNQIFEYFIKPFRAGLSGFLILFGIVILIKLFGRISGVKADFEILAADYFISFMGFLTVFTIRLLANFRDKGQED